MIEFDIRRTRDGKLVIHHDASLRGHRIGKHTYKELRKLSDTIGFKIPLMSELLELAKGRIKLDAELKEEGYEDEVIGMLKSRFNVRDLIITSFNIDSLRRIKERHPKIKTGLLVDLRKLTGAVHARPGGIFSAKRGHSKAFDFLGLNWKLLNFGFLKRARILNLPLLVWTVNRRVQLEKMLKLNVEGIITDKLELALGMRDEIH